MQVPDTIPPRMSHAGRSDSSARVGLPETSLQRVGSAEHVGFLAGDYNGCQYSVQPGPKDHFAGNAPGLLNGARSGAPTSDRTLHSTAIAIAIFFKG